MRPRPFDTGERNSVDWRWPYSAKAARWRLVGYPLCWQIRTQDTVNRIPALKHRGIL